MLWKTKRGTDEWRSKISRSLKGRSSPKYWLGKKHDEDYKRKMSLSLSGKKNPRFGVKIDSETKRKISESVKRWFAKNGTSHLRKPRPKTSAKLKGHKLSLETRKKIADKARGRPVSLETRQKRSNSLRGEKCYLWKGGITPENKEARMTLGYKVWRESVFKRDSWTCQKCRQKGRELHPHHIVNFADEPKLRLMVSNGITLCKSCHEEFHTHYGKTKNTRKQLEEFMRGIFVERTVV